MSYAMFGVPNQVYDVGRKYFADTTGMIADVPDLNDRKALRDAGVLDENPIVAVTSSDAIGAVLTVAGRTGNVVLTHSDVSGLALPQGTSGQVQMTDGAGNFAASQITDTGTAVKIANGQIETPPATPIILISDTGVALGAYPTQGQDTINAGAVYANSVELTPAILPTTRTVSITTDTILSGDNGNAVYYTNSGAVAVTLPDALSGGEFGFLWIQGGAGKLTFAGSGGATAHGEGGKVASSGTQWATGSVWSPAAHVFVVAGSTS